MVQGSQQRNPAATVDDLFDTLAELVADRVVARLGHAQERDEWLDLREAAEYLSLHRDALGKRAREGRIPFEQAGPRCRMYFRRSDLDASRHASGAPVCLAHVADLSARRTRSR
jgi:excisionase family DNA binding protein